MNYKNKIYNDIYLSNLDLTNVSHALGVHVHKKDLTEIWQKMNKCLCKSLFIVQLLCDLSRLRAHVTTQINMQSQGNYDKQPASYLQAFQRR